MDTLKLKMHTVVVTVGPSGCGKSYFSELYLRPTCKEQLFPQLPSWRPYTNIQYLSSDEIRKELLGNTAYGYEKHTTPMMAVSEQAFQLLYKKLELVCSYPVNAELVIVDTTGLNKQFRQTIIDIAKKASYNTCCLLFKYKKREEYLKYIEDTHDLYVVSDHIKRLNREVLSELKGDKFDQYFTVKQKDFSTVDIQFDVGGYKDFFLEPHLEYPVIGDIHGCYDELLALLDQLHFKIENGVIVEKPSHKYPIIVGDFIDGQEMTGVAKVIEFLWVNRSHFKFVLGNHENFVYKFLKDELSGNSLPPADFMADHFPTIAYLQNKPELTTMFCDLRELSKDFYIGSNFIVTHAPCEDKFLGKLDLGSLKMQRNYRYPHREKDEPLEKYSERYEDALGFLKSSAAANKPIHIFGHCRMTNVLRIKNKIGIDTGACQGNRLTAATVVKNKVFYNSVPSALPKYEELPSLYTKKDAATVTLPDIDLSTLDPKEMGRIRWSAKHKVNYISGTMSPSASDEGKNTLESMEKCFEYFKHMEVDHVVLQPKYMGSRAELFLNIKDISQSYTTTRKGHLIDHVDLASAYTKIHARMAEWAAERDFEWLLLDCELMPWYALGKGLIRQQYEPVSYGLESELALLQETGFEDQLLSLKKEYEESEYKKVCHTTAKEQLKKLFPAHKCANYEAVKNFQWIPLDKQLEYFSVYKRQLELYAQDGEIHFKPFGLLKAIKSTGEEVFFYDMSNDDQFKLLSDDRFLVVSLKDENALQEAETFFKMVVDAELEGVVVKPKEPYLKGVAPYMKVRNPNYLSIIYGYEYTYQPKYEKLVRQKRIGKKLKASIDQFEYGKRMLEIPRGEISMDNKEYVSLFAKLIFEEKSEARFDPRL